MAIEGSVADITPVVSPDRAEHDILGSILDDFWATEPFLWSGSNCVM